METRFDNVVISDRATVRDALRAIDRGGIRFALVVDSGARLVATVTDGDTRRGLLRGVGIDSSVTEVMRRNPLVVHQREARTAAMNLIRDYKLVGVPIVDDDRRIVGLELIEELIGPPTSDNWVVLMAGGLGARLRPLTESVPKPMLPIGGRPILETIMRNFSAQGFRRFFVSVNYRREMIQSHFGDGREFGVEISYLVEEKPLGTAGSLCLLPERPSKPLIVMNGDLLAALPFHDVMRFHEHHCADATVCVMPYITEIPFGVVTFAAERMTGIEEKPKHQCMVNAGIYVLGPVAFDYLQHGERNDMTSVLERLIKAGRNVCVFRLQKSWVDIGRLDDLQRAEDEFSMLAPGLTID